MPAFKSSVMKSDNGNDGQLSEYNTSEVDEVLCIIADVFDKCLLNHEQGPNKTHGKYEQKCKELPIDRSDFRCQVTDHLVHNHIEHQHLYCVCYYHC